MKRLLIFTITLFAMLPGLMAQSSSPFPYPQVPDTLGNLQARSDYLLMHFWDKADIKKLVNDTTALNEAFADYVTFMPYASSDSVRTSITNLIKSLKSDPKYILAFVKSAEKNMFSPESSVKADQAYMLFTRAVLSNKKINPKEKARYVDQVKMLNSSQLGSMVLPLSYVTRHGAEHQLYEQPGEFKLMYFHWPNHEDSMTELRLQTDAALSALSKDGRVKIFDLYVGNPEQALRQNMESFPYEWEVGWAPNAPSVIDLRVLPTFYLLDGENKIMGRDMSIDAVLQIMSAIYLKNMQ